MRSVGSGEHFCTFHELARTKGRENVQQTMGQKRRERMRREPRTCSSRRALSLSGSTSLRVVYWPHIFDGRILAPRLQVLFETAGCLYKRRRRRRGRKKSLGDGRDLTCFFLDFTQNVEQCWLHAMAVECVFPAFSQRYKWKKCVCQLLYPSLCFYIEWVAVVFKSENNTHNMNWMEGIIVR